MRMKRFWRKLKGGDGGKNGDRAPINAALGGASEKCQRQQETREPEQLWSVASGALAVCSDAPQAEATAKSSLTPGNTCIEAAVPGGEPDTCSSLKGFRRSEPPADEPPSTPERTSPDIANSVSPVVLLQVPPSSPDSSPEAPSEEGEPEFGTAPGTQGESLLPQEVDGAPWGVPVPRTSRWQVDVSRLSGARRVLREAPSGSSDSTLQSSFDAVACSPCEDSSEVTSPALQDREQHVLDPAVCLPGLPACPTAPSCNGGLRDPDGAPQESAPAEGSLDALLQAAVLAREESASRAAAALAAAAHLDGVLRAARVASSVQAHTTGSPPQATLQALLTVCEEGQGPLGRDRPAWAAAWVEAALQGGMAALPPPMPGARLTLPNGKLRTAVAPISSPALAARSPLSGGGRNGTRRAGAVVTTPAPSLLPTRVEGQSPARRAGEVTGARPTPDERQGEHGDPGRACALSGAERWQPASSTPPATLASPAEHSGEALLTAGIRATSSAEGGPGPGAIGSALEARVRDSVERQLVAAVEAVVGGGREGATGTRGSSSGRAAAESLPLLHRAHQQLTQIEASSADSALRAKAATARDGILKHITAYVND